MDTNTVVFMGFDASSSADAQYIKGGEQGLENLMASGRYVDGLPASFGQLVPPALHFEKN